MIGEQGPARSGKLAVFLGFVVLLLISCAHSPEAPTPVAEEIFHSPESGWIDCAGISIHYYDSRPGGPGEDVVVLVHGWMGSAYNFSRLVRYFPEDMRVVAVDLPGFGLSDAPAWDISMTFFSEFVEEFCATLQLETVTLVGSSMGSNVVIHLAASHPRRVEKIVLLSPYALKVQGGLAALILRRQKLVSKNFGRVDREYVADFLKRRVVVDADTVSEDVVDSYYLVLSSGEGRRYAAHVTADVLTRSWADELLPGITCPILIVVGTCDRVWKPAVARKYARLAPESELAEIEGCGHVLFLEQPEQTASAILSFLGE
jgi:pimeloyl-ACP methyl ester carboxylesterase